MGLSERQHDIVNPFAAKEGYNFGNPRNKLVIGGIHNCYINYGFFPAVGYLLRDDNSGLITPDNNNISVEDLEAYLQIYPQNGRYSAPLRTIVNISSAEEDSELERLVGRLRENEVLPLYKSPTSHEARLPQNQAAVTGTDNISPEDIMRQDVAQLIAIPYSWGREDRATLAHIFKLPAYAPLDTGEGEISANSPLFVPQELQPSDIDLEVWTNNVPPGTLPPKLYYNMRDYFYYFARHTLDTNPSSYDTGRPADSNNNIATATRQGVTAILRASHKYTQANYQSLIDSSDVEFDSFLDRRPNSRWSYALKIPKSEIDNLPTEEALNLELSEASPPLEIAQILIDRQQNLATKHAVYSLFYLKKACGHIADALGYYMTVLKRAGIGSNKLDGLIINKERGRVQLFPTDLEEFLSLNNIQPTNRKEDSVHLPFAPNMKVNYVIYNGTLYNRFLGKTIFDPQGEEDGEEGVLVVSELNIFGRQSSRSLGYIFYARDILSKTKLVLHTQWPTWAEFITSYTIPTPRISPQTMSKKSSSNPSLTNDSPKLFETLAELSRKGQGSLISSDPRGWTSRNYYNDVNSALGKCDSGLANRIRDLSVALSALNGSMNTSSLINRAVGYAREELLKRNMELLPIDPQFREALGLEAGNEALERYIRNPSIPLRLIEEKINKEIRCLLQLDAIGAAVEEQLLQPYALPPDAANLIRSAANPPFGISFSKTPFRGNVWETYIKGIETLFVRLLTQIIFGVVRELLQTALGCGPEKDKQSSEDAQGLLEERLHLYGFVNLNDFIGGVDIVEVGIETGLANKAVTFSNDEPNNPTSLWKVSVARSTPHLPQLKQLHDDVSQITTPEELKQLLTGEASEDLLDVIYEMINLGLVDKDQMREDYPEIINNPAIAALNQNDLVASLYQESLHPDDVRYASLGWEDTNIISNYFKTLGDKLTETQKLAVLLEKQSPEEAYCPPNEIPNPFEGLSDHQIKSQLTQRLQQTQDRVESLCGAGQWDLSGLKSMLDLWDGIGLPPWLQEKIEALRKWASQINDMMANFMSNPDNMYPAPALTPRETCIGFGNTQMWQDLSYGMAMARSFLAVPELAVRTDQPVGTPNKIVYRTNWGGISLALETSNSEALIRVENLGQNIELPSQGEINSAYNIVTMLRNLYGTSGFTGPPLRFLRVFVDVLTPFTSAGWQDRAEAGENLNDLHIFLQSAYPFSGEPVFAPNGIIPAPDGFAVCSPPSDTNAHLLDYSPANPQNPDPFESLLIREWHQRAHHNQTRSDMRFRWLTITGNEMENMTSDPPLVGPALTRYRGGLPDNKSVCRILGQLGANAPLAGIEGDLGGARTMRQSEALKDIYVGKVLARISLPEEDAIQLRPVPLYDKPFTDVRSTALSGISQRSIRNINGKPSDGILVTINETQREFEQREGRARMPVLDLIQGHVPQIPSLTEGWVQGEVERLLSANSRLSRIVSNGAENSYEQICSIWYLSSRQTDLQKAMKEILKNPFTETGDCANDSLVRTMMMSLEARIIPLIINTLPVQRVYMGWNTPTTISLLTDYLFRKIIWDLREKGLSKVFADNIGDIYELYGESLTSDENTPFDVNTTTYEEQLKHLIERWIITTLYDIRENSRYWAGGENFYAGVGHGAHQIDPGGGNDLTPFDAYIDLITELCFRLRNNNNSTQVQKDFMDRMINTLEFSGDYSVAALDLRGALALGSYYFPIPLLNALYLITYDITNHISEAYGQYRQAIWTQKDSADEKLFKIINPSYVSPTVGVMFNE